MAGMSLPVAGLTARTVAYWIATGLFSVGMGMSAAVYLSGQPFAIEAMTDHLGFPVYMLHILGVAKVLGIVALLTPAFLTLKEWAYAGFTFNLLGAIWSHVAVGDPFSESLGPAVFLGMLGASYVLRPDPLKQPAIVVGAS